jgi:hypothetical protein
LYHTVPPFRCAEKLTAQRSPPPCVCHHLLGPLGVGESGRLYYIHARQRASPIRIVKTIEIKSTNGQTWKVMPRWKGKNVAVHAPVVEGVCGRKDDQWVITHLQSGQMTGGYFNGSLKEALLSARIWDEAFSTVSEKTAKVWPLAIQWKRILRQGKAERPWIHLDRVKTIVAKRMA